MNDLLEKIAQSTDIAMIMRARGKLFCLARVGLGTTFDLYQVERWLLVKSHPIGLRLLNSGEILIRMKEGIEIMNPEDNSIHMLDTDYIAYDTAYPKNKVEVTATKEFLNIRLENESFSFSAPEGFQRLYLSSEGDKLVVISTVTDALQETKSHIQIWTIISKTMMQTTVSGIVVEAKWSGIYLFLKLNQDDFISVVFVDSNTLEIKKRTGTHVPLELNAELVGVKPTLGGTIITNNTYDWTVSSTFVDGPVIGLVTSTPGSSYSITIMEKNQVTDFILPPYHFEVPHHVEAFMLNTQTRTIPSLRITPLTKSTHNCWAVIFHGGPHDTYQGEWNPIIGTLLVHGWNILCPNVKGSTGFGKAYAQLQGNWGIEDLEDALTSTTYALAQTSKVVVIGMSYGGYLAALVGTQLGTQVLGFVGINGIYSPSELSKSVPPLVGEWLQREQVTYRTPDAVKLSNRYTRGLLIHALNDEVAPANQAIALAEAIALKGGQVESMWIEGEGHTITNPVNAKEALEKIVEFVGEDH